MSLPKPEAIIFDWDNTLVNTWPIIHSALNETFKELDLPLWTIAETQARVGQSMRDSFPKLFGQELWEQAASKYQGHYRAQHLSNLEPLPKSLELLEHIKRLSIPTVLVSNKRGPTLRDEVKHLNWGEYFDNEIGAGDADKDKPHPHPVHLAFKASDITPNENVWFVGDSEVDLQCAANTGCTAILYGPIAETQGNYNDTHFAGHAYARHVRNHDETLKLLSF